MSPAGVRTVVDVTASSPIWMTTAPGSVTGGGPETGIGWVGGVPGTGGSGAKPGWPQGSLGWFGSGYVTLRSLARGRHRAGGLGGRFRVRLAPRQPPVRGQCHRREQPPLERVPAVLQGVLAPDR